MVIQADYERPVLACLICLASTSRGRADERAANLPLNAQNSAAVDAALAGDLDDAFILVASIQRQRLNVLGAARPTGRKPEAQIWLQPTRKCAKREVRHV
jgi:hypothetical protein